MITALEGGEWSARPARTLPPGKTRYPLYRRLGGPQGRSGRAENLTPPGFHPRTVQPVTSRYTDWTNRGVSLSISLYSFDVLVNHEWRIMIKNIITIYSDSFLEKKLWEIRRKLGRFRGVIFIFIIGGGPRGTEKVTAVKGVHKVRLET